MRPSSMTFALAATLAASASLTTPAIAGGNIETVAVHYSDLDLSTPQGQRALERRLRDAAEEVCGIDRRTTGFRLPSTASRACLAEAVKDFDREIALHTARQQEQQRSG